MSNNPVPLTARTPVQAVVKRHLPEHVREDYPTFVAFVEAYYEYLQRNGVDLKQVRDIDTTLEQFIEQFKKELAYNLPNVVEDERFLLQKIKDQYLAKGSEASYKLLFKLLYGKEVELIYPGRSMLIASDGRWNQEISVFAQIDFGNPDDIVGKLVDIQTAGRILRVLVDKKEQLTGEVDRIVKIGKSFEISTTAPVNSTVLNVSTNTGIEINQLVTGNGIQNGTKVVSVNGSTVTISKPTIDEINSFLIYSNELYEFFLDKKFFGVVNPGDLIKFRDEFQAVIVPATQTISINQPGRNFRIGQVFELRSGSGTGALMKVTSTTLNGGIKYAELIKFGLGYTADFALSILASNDVISSSTVNIVGSSTLTQLNTYQAAGAGNISADPTSTTVTGSSTTFGQTGSVQVGDELWTTDTTPLLIGVVKSIESTTSLTLDGLSSEHDSGITSSYTGSFVFRNSRNIGSLYAPGGVQSITYDSSVIDKTEGFNEQGYVNLGDYVTADFVDGTYAGTVIREFSLNFRNAQVDADEPAIIGIKLGAIVRYPGFFESNNGFLSDSIFIQDSRYYQAFSYVIKIDERLSSYKSAVKTMLHPAGMALFGEFQITNNYDLSLELESLVKSLGIGLQDLVASADSTAILNFAKALSSSINTPLDVHTINFAKVLEDSSSPIAQHSLLFTKSINQNTINFDEDIEGHSVSPVTTSVVRTTTKSLSTPYSGMVDTTPLFDFSKTLADAPVITESHANNTAKYLQTTSVGTLIDSGKVWTNSYQAQDYYSEEYSVGLSSTFTS
jgi:hypothetical protein